MMREERLRDRHGVAVAIRAARASPRQSLSGAQSPDTASERRRDLQAAAALAPLAGLGKALSLAAGDLLFRYGDPAAAFCLVNSGVFKSYSGPPDHRYPINGLFGIGDIIGLDAADTYASTVKAVTRCSVSYFVRSEVEVAARDSQALSGAVSAAMADRLSAVRDQLQLILQPSADKRVAGLLLLLSQRGLGPKSTADLIWWPLSLADMGDFLSLSQETVSRALSRLNRAGLIGTRVKGFVRVIDMQRLEDLVMQP